MNNPYDLHSCSKHYREEVLREVHARESIRSAQSGGGARHLHLAERAFPARQDGACRVVAGLRDVFEWKEACDARELLLRSEGRAGGSGADPRCPRAVGPSVPRLWPPGLFELALGGGRSPCVGRGEIPARGSTRGGVIPRDEVVYRRIQQRLCSDRMFGATRWRTTTIRASPSYQGSQPLGFAPSWPGRRVAAPAIFLSYSQIGQTRRTPQLPLRRTSQATWPPTRTAF